MVREAVPNAYVLNSNLAQPISKIQNDRNIRRFTARPRQETGYVGCQYLEVPDKRRANRFYSVNGFIIPNPIVLRVLHREVAEDQLWPAQRQVSAILAPLSRGVTLHIDTKQSDWSIELSEIPPVIEPVEGIDTFNGYQWELQANAFSEEFGIALRIGAVGVRGHALHSYPAPKSLAVLELL